MPISLTTRANDQGAFLVTAAFTDETGAAVTPKTLSWSLYNWAGEIINNRQDEVISTPSSSQDLLLSGNDIKVSDGTVRVLEFTGTYDSSAGTDIPLRESVQFEVTGLRTTRVNDADVKAILDTSVDTTPFIKMAHLTVNQWLLNQGLPDDLLKEIERCLAAHITCMRDPQAREEDFGGGARTVYQGQTGLGLDATFYGQQVKVLDSTGLLAQVGKRVVQFKAITEDYS